MGFIMVLQIQNDDNSIRSSLVDLRLDYNNLHSLTPNIFKELSHLVSLSLAGNPLKVIDRSTNFALSSLPFLKVRIKLIIHLINEYEYL